MAKNIKDILALEALYYQQSSSETQYNAMGQGFLDIAQVLKGNPKMFKLLSSGMVSKNQKTLIFWDPMYKGWSPSKQTEVENCLQTLLDAHFVILGLSESGISLEPIESPHAFFSRENYNICPYFSTSREILINDAIVLAGKPRSEICFLDTFTINRMVNLAYKNSFNTERLEITISEAKTLLYIDNIPAKLLHETLNQSYPGGVQWILDRMTIPNFNLFEQLLTLAPEQCSIIIDTVDADHWRNLTKHSIKMNRTFTPQYNQQGVKIIIHWKDDRQLMNETIKYLCEITTIKEIELCNHDFQPFHLDFSGIKSLEKLKFTDCEEIGLIMDKLENILEKLQHLSFVRTNISMDTFLSMINKAKALKSISMIENNHRSFLDWKDQTLNLTEIESLTISKTEYLSSKIFKGIDKLRKSSALKYIDLSSSDIHSSDGNLVAIEDLIFKLEDNHEPSMLTKHINRYYNLLKLELSHLKNIDCRSIDIDNEKLQTILNTCLAVESLDISGQLINNIVIGDILQYKHLRKLSMAGDANDIDNMIRRTSSLESLSLTMIDDDFLYDTSINTMANIHELSIYACRTLYPFFQTLSTARKLKTVHLGMLELDAYDNRSDDCIAIINSLHEINIEHLSVTLSHISSVQNTLLFNTLINVRFLKIHLEDSSQSYVDSDTIEHQFNPNAFRKVERLEITVDCGGELEFSLINLMPNLKELTIIMNIDSGYRAVELNEIPSLRKLTVINNGMRCNEMLISLINQSIHLKNISIMLFDEDDTDYQYEDWTRFNIQNTELEVIDVSNGLFLDKDTLYELLSKNRHVRELRIRNRNDLENFIIPTGLKQLKIIDIDHVPYDLEHMSELSDISGNSIMGFKALPKRIMDTNRIEREAASDSLDIDANTMLSPAKYHVTQFFRSRTGEAPNPTIYRESVYNYIQLNPGVFERASSPFTLSNIGTPLFKACPDIIVSHEQLEPIFNAQQDDNRTHFFLGRKQIVLNGSPQRLPSLHPNEKMTHIYIRGLSPNDFIIQYSTRDNFYYISSTDSSSTKIEVEYIICTPCAVDCETDPIYGDPSLPKELPSEFDSGTAQEWLDRMIEYKAGACRHKVIAYFHENVNMYQNIRIVLNQSHAYIEQLAHESNIWQKIDLGGHPAQLNINARTFEPKKDPEKGEQLGVNPAFLVENTKNEFEGSPKEWIYHLMNSHAGKNVYIDFRDNETLDTFQQLMRELAHHEGRPVYYIDSADDIACHAPRMLRDEKNNGKLTFEPGGPLFDFLRSHHRLNPILLINFNSFSSEELVRFNSIIDKERIIDREKVPKKTAVIGLYQSQRIGAYTGTDFSSRFDIKLKPEFKQESLKQCMNPMYQRSDEIQGPSVYLHNSDAWRSLLLGMWHLSPRGWVYKEGPLIEAIKKGKSITLHDAPWHDRDFQCFINNIRIDKSVIIDGVRYSIPDRFSIHFGKPYPIDDYAKQCAKVYCLTDDYAIPSDWIILNSVTFPQLFQEYFIDADTLCSREGVLASAKPHSTLNFYVTHDITLSEWSRLVQIAHDKGVYLNIYTREGLELQNPIQHCLQDTAPGIEANQTASCVVVIHTTDTHESIAIMRDKLSNILTFDCTGLQPSDLFSHITRRASTDLLSFEKKDSIIDTLLDSGTDVILTGTPSAELEQYLCQWAISRKQTQHKLYLVTDKEIPAYKHIAAFLTHHLPAPDRRSHKTFTENIEADDFIQERTVKLRKALSTSAIVLITGPTGVGKSTFMLDHFAKNTKIELHNGLDNIDYFLNSMTTDKDIVLFIDEANITEDKKQEWTEFSGLVLNPSSPTILWKGKSYPLTSRHKVVFAGNPHSYGGERHQPSLFSDHPITELEFKPIKSTVLAAAVLNPVLGHLTDYDNIYHIFVQIYDEVLALSGTNAIITPRELKHMAHMYLAYAQDHTENPTELARQCAITMAKQLLPSSLHSKLSLKAAPLSLPTEEPMRGYFVTQSRKPIESRLNEFLAIRDMKIKNQKITGGLGGLVLEGDPGTGKSEHVVAQLVAQGFSEGEHYWREDKRFYRIPVNLGYAQKKALLTKAYIEGAVVIVDEINTSPAMERFYNDALSGTFEVPITIPTTMVKPGFLLIGTQNPIGMEGRRTMSVAMQRRLMHVEVPPYQHDEMVEVLVKGHAVKPLLAEQIVADFERANRENKTPLPFRVLLKRYREAVPFIVETYALRCRSLSIRERMDFIHALLVEPLPESVATSKTALIDRRTDGPRKKHDLPQSPPQLL